MKFNILKKDQGQPKTQSFQLRAQVDSEIEITTQALLGREYTVVPVIAMVEGVRFGANAEAPELGLASEFGQDLIMWANRPLVLNHPQTDFEGEMIYCSANSPEILEQYCFGMTMNPYVEDSKLKMQAWIDNARVAEIGGEFQGVVDSIMSGDMVEVSVGFFSTLEDKKGKWKGQAYSGIWRNIKPDHLAILSIGTLGACSNADGCGIPRINQKEAEMAKPSIKVDNTAHAAQSCGCGGHEKTSCTCEDAKLTGQTKVPTTQEEIDDLENHLVEEADRTEVRNFNAKMVAQAIDGMLTDSDVRKLLHRALRAKYSNCDCYLYGFTQDKALFEMYGHWHNNWNYMTFQIGINVTESGVEFVGEAEEVVLLTKIVPQVAVSQPGASSTTVQTKENDMTEVTSPTTTVVVTPAEAAVPVAQAAPVTVQSYIASAPEEIRDVLESSIKMHSDRKNSCIEKIKAHKGNKFSDETLKAFKLDVLESMVALMGEEAATPNYSGVAAPVPVTQSTTDNGAVPEPPRLFAVKTNA